MRFAFAFTGVILVLVLGGCATHPPAPSVAPPPSVATVATANAAPASFALVVDAPQDLAPLLGPAIARAEIPGIAAVVLRGDRIVARGVAGVRKKGGTERITVDDRFEICSCAKAMTAALAARLIEEGRLDWKTTLGKTFGEAFGDMDPAWNDVTLEQLLAHRAGLTDKHLFRFLSSVLFSGSLLEQRRTFAHKILSDAPDFPPGSTAIYTSADYVLAAAMLEKITGRSYEESLQELVFQPLGITSAGFGPPGTAGKVDQPWGHGARRLLYVPLPGDTDVPIDPGSSGADFPLAGAPAGLVHLAVTDWAKFVAWQLRGDPANPRRDARLLRPETFAHLHAAGIGEIFMFPSDKNPIRHTGYTAGWFTTTRSWARGGHDDDTGRVLYHLGDNGRWNCAVWIAPEIDFAVLVACNRAAMWVPCDEIVAKLVEEFASKSD